MSPTSRKAESGHFPSLLTSLAIAIGLVVAGCLPNPKTDVRQPDTDANVTPAAYTASPEESGPNGRVIAPRRCTLTVAILSRPMNDPALNDQLWSTVDEQVGSIDMLRLLGANGLRAGVISGGLPMSVEAVLNPPPPGKKIDPVTFDQFDDQPAHVPLAASSEPVTLLISRGGRTVGKDYIDAKGLLRLTAARNGSGGVKIKVVPEIHHGPVKQGYTATATDEFQPRELVFKNGQAEESFRELAAEFSIRPGQVLVLGSRGEAGRSLGGFLFTQAEPNSDRVDQRVVLIWASPASAFNANNGGKERSGILSPLMGGWKDRDKGKASTP